VVSFAMIRQEIALLKGPLNNVMKVILGDL
jgi:hypothetical protein